MTKVGLPSVVESFQRALQEVLAPFLSTGNPTMVMGLMVWFYKCDLYFNQEKLAFNKDKPRERPFIAILGTRTTSETTLKNLDPRQPQQPLGYEIRQQVARSVYVGIPRTLTFIEPPYSDLTARRQSSMLDVERVWSQLHLVLEHQHQAWNARGIFAPRIPPIPVQASDLDYYLVQGDLQAEIRYQLTRNNMPY